MLNVLWSLLNVAVLIGILFTFYRAAQLLKRQFGWGAALFFVFSLSVTSCGKSGDKATGLPIANLLANPPKNEGVGNASTSHHIDLGGNIQLTVLAEYFQQDSLIRPHGLFVTVSGVVLGHRWTPILGRLMPEGRQLRYSVIVNHEWRLLNVLIFNDMGEQFTGLMPLAKN